MLFESLMGMRVGLILSLSCVSSLGPGTRLGEEHRGEGYSGLELSVSAAISAKFLHGHGQALLRMGLRLPGAVDGESWVLGSLHHKRARSRGGGACHSVPHRLVFAENRSFLAAPSPSAISCPACFGQPRTG